MNSLRASGVMSFQASSAVLFASSASRRSAGNSCTTPPGTEWPLTGPTVARPRYGEPGSVKLTSVPALAASAASFMSWFTAPSCTMTPKETATPRLCSGVHCL